MKAEYGRYIGTYLAPVILAALIGLAQIEQVFAQDSGYSIARYDPVEANIEYRLQTGEIPDRYCGDPTIDGWIALNEKLVGRELGSTIGEIWYIQETDPQSDKQVLQGCAIDAAAAQHVDGILSNGERPANQILDASKGIFEDIYPYTGIVVTHEDPRGKNDNISPIQQSITDDAEISIYEESQIYDFHVDVSPDDTKIDEVSLEEPPTTIITSGTVYDSSMNEEGTGTPVNMPLFKESSAPIKIMQCTPGPADNNRNFVMECPFVYAEEDEYFEYKPAQN